MKKKQKKKLYKLSQFLSIQSKVNYEFHTHLSTPQVSLVHSSKTIHLKKNYSKAACIYINLIDLIKKYYLQAGNFF